MAFSAPGKSKPNGSPKTQSPGRLKNNLCPENRVRYRAWYNLGNANIKLAHYPEAIAAYRPATLLNPGFADVWNNLSVAYAKSGNRSAALEAAKELSQYDPQGAEVLVNLLMKY
jgi:tetratricopeptide (TPR) repeat protein